MIAGLSEEASGVFRRWSEVGERRERLRDALNEFEKNLGQIYGKRR
jgi:hypothetical protein